ncbi:MAG: hypothetical protein NWE94_04605 [Candidatus Bathyarchaeota archaeon]|nr:hypothetical protein [Candidatus Bathyarchaeota archaeon]
MNADSKLKDLIFIRYIDHVLYNRAPALTMKPQTREAVGWLVYDCEQYVILSWDRDAEPSTLHGGDPKASGLVLLKADILEFRKLEACQLPPKENSECRLNSQKTTSKTESALQPEKRKTQEKKKGTTK